MKLAIIVATTRVGRKTLQQAKWAAKLAANVDGIDAEIVDLADYPMPFFDEPVSPRYNPSRQIDSVAKKWLDKLNEFDAYLFVTAEYNHSIPAVLKNALDYVDFQFIHKPGAVISHGSAGGARAQVHLKQILSESKMAVVPSGPGVAIVHMSDIIDEEGNMSAEAAANPYGPKPAVEDLLNDLKWYSDALAAARK
ncbi:MAG: reductase [Candidatus Saccharibacteria bacterium]|nr:reductase [Candidatus Saccharibacteria bacterium]